MEQLLELRESHRQQGAIIQTSTTVRLGDVVLLHEHNLPRGFWKLGRVEKLITGKDGSVHGALARVPPKNGHPTLLQRPVQLLYPLEISSDCSSDQTNQDPCTHQEVTIHDKTVELPEPSRLQRRSALKARGQFKEWSRTTFANSDFDSS